MDKIRMSTHKDESSKANVASYRNWAEQPSIRTLANGQCQVSLSLRVYSLCNSNNIRHKLLTGAKLPRNLTPWC